MNSIKYFIIILYLLLLGCTSGNPNLSIKNELKSFNIEIKINKLKLFNNKIYFDLSFLNKSDVDQILIIGISSFYLEDNYKNLYPIYIDELLGNKTSRELYIKSKSNKKISVYSPKRVLNKDSNFSLTIKKNIISELPILHKQYIGKNIIKDIKITYTSFDGKSFLDAIGYTINCYNSKEFYLEIKLNNKVIIYDRQKKKDILEFKKSKIDQYMSQICTY